MAQLCIVWLIHAFVCWLSRALPLPCWLQ